MYYFAEKLGGLAIALEHRYFGLSTPFGPVDSYTQDNIAFLTLDNVMMDAENFINQVKQNVTGAEDSHAIVASGSYGGFLAAVFRLNYPDTFYGSIASAAPVRSFGAVGDVDQFNWWTWVSIISI